MPPPPDPQSPPIGDPVPDPDPNAPPDPTDPQPPPTPGDPVTRSRLRLGDRQAASGSVEDPLPELRLRRRSRRRRSRLLALDHVRVMGVLDRGVGALRVD